MKLSFTDILVVASMTLMTMGFQCEKGDYVESKIDYQFSEKLILAPYKKVYAINDTIWVQFQTTNKSLFDKSSSSRIATDTTFLNITFNYHRRYPVGSVEEFFSYAKVDNGNDVTFTTLYAWYNVLKFKTNCSDNRYFFKVGFVPNNSSVSF